MRKRSFEFELYRLNSVQGENNLFNQMNKQIRPERDIVRILENSVKPEFACESSGTRNIYEWAVRDFVQYFHERDEGEVYGLTIARSVIKIQGEIVTNTSIEEGVAEMDPPLADTCRLFFYMKRHLVAVERHGRIINSCWKKSFEDILKTSANDLGYTGWIELEPVSHHEEIIKAFRSFHPLTRLRLILRLPNPEFSRFAKKLYNEMEDGAIQEYRQDMRNPRGLSKMDGKLPHASLEIAASGYKKDEVIFEGMQDNKRTILKTGKTAARGLVEGLKDYVRGMKDIAHTNESREAMSAILDEIDRVAPPPKHGKE